MKDNVLSWVECLPVICPSLTDAEMHKCKISVVMMGRVSSIRQYALEFIYVVIFLH